MRTFFTPLVIILVFVLVRAGDLAISAGIHRDFVRAVAYGLVSLFALIVLIITLLAGGHVYGYTQPAT
jgi:hypothetical protein